MQTIFLDRSSDSYNASLDMISDKYDIDVFTIGDDWEGHFDFLKEEGVEVVYLPRTPEISSSQIKRDLHSDRSDLTEDSAGV